MWNNPTTWTGGPDTPGPNDTVLILDGHSVGIFTGSGESVHSIMVETGGVIDIQNKTFSVSGTFIIDGTLTSDDNSAKDIDFDGDKLGGTGIIAINDESRYLDVAANAEILAISDLKIFGNVHIRNGVTIINKGHLEVYGSLDGADATGSVWTNDAGSEIEISGIFMNTGILNASAPDNTVTYFEQGDQSVKTPSVSTYYNLIISGTGTKSISSDLIIDNDILIKYSSLDCDGYNLEVRGNWTNESEFVEATGNVTFNGTEDQFISCVDGEVFYDLSVDKSSGLLILETNVQAINNLTITSGVIDADNNILTLGSGLASPGTLTYTSGHINGKFERWLSSAGTYDFPIGSLSSNQQLSITLNGIDTGGSLISEFYDSDAGSLGLPLYDNPDSVFNEFMEGYWSLNEANGFTLGVSNSYDISLDGNGFSSFTIDGSTRVLLRADAGSLWTTEGTHAAPVGSVVRRFGMNTLPAEFALGDTTNCTRPVTSLITGLTEVCTGESAVSYEVSDNPPNSYTWYITGGTQVSGGNTHSITVDWGAEGMLDGNVRVIESNTCTKGVPVDLPVKIHAVQPEMINGRVSVAENTNGEPYSVEGIAGYSYNWTIIGGTQASGGTSDSITVNWGSNGTGYVSVTAELAGCTPSPATQLSVNKYVIIESIATGDWTDAATWDCNCIPLPTDNVRINTAHTVTLITGGAGTEANNFIIAAGGELEPNNRQMTIHGNFELDGTYLGGSKDLTMDGFGKYIDGVGNLEQGIVLTSDIYFTTTAVIDITSGDLEVGPGVTVYNYGSLNLTDNMIGLNASSRWINKTNATLKIGGTLFSGNGLLDASATGNNVYYNGAADQTVKTPATSYYNLIIDGAGTKSLSGDLDVNGDIAILSGSSFDVTANNYTINIAHNWLNMGGGFNERAGTVIFDGSSNQFITGTETFYNLSTSNTAGLYLNDNAVVSNTLSMNGGNISTQGNILTIGTSAGSPGSLVHTSGTVVGQLERWITSTATPYLFPIGTSSDYRPATITFSDLATGTVLSEFIATDPGSSGLPLSEGTVNITDQYTEGYWSLTANNGLTTSDFSMQLTANNFSSYAIIPGTRIISRLSGGNWVLDGTHAPAAAPDVFRNNLTGGISLTGTEFGIGHIECTGLSIDRNIQDVSCYGGNDGAIDITVNGGTPPYSYSWGHGPATEDVAGLTAGSYSINVMDVDGCEIDSTFTVNEPAILNAVVNSVPITCTGGNDGSITMSSPSGGSGYYEYSINGGASWQSSGAFTNLSAGSYDIRIRDELVITCFIILDGAHVLTEPNDGIPPVAVCRDITVQLDGSGNATIATVDIDNGSSDNCGIAFMFLDITSFTCGDVGLNTVTLTVIDGSGNNDLCTATVTVEDHIPPVITVCAANRPVVLNGSCELLVPDMTGEVVASDNCTATGSLSVTQAPAAGVLLSSGEGMTHTVVMTVDDGQGNSATCDVTLTGDDATDPVITTCPPDTTETVDGGGDFTIPDYTGLLTATDNCNPAPVITQNPVTGTVISGAGTVHTIILTASDGNGNSAQCSFDITLVAPEELIITCPGNMAEYLDSDCGFTIPDYRSLAAVTGDTGVTQEPSIGSTISGHGTVQTITLTAHDGLGNSESCMFDITLIDTISPLAVCEDITVQLDSAGNAAITASDVDGGSTDNCSIVSNEVVPNSFTCSDLGINNVTLTVTDINGNSAMCNTEVTIIDPIQPQVTCPGDTTIIATDGSCSTVVNGIAPVSYWDNCTPDVISYRLEGTTVGSGQDDASGISFNVGITTVWYRITDSGENSDSCSFDVTILTTLLPPETAFSDRDSVCPGDGYITLSYTGGDPGNGSAAWYSDASFSTFIGSGNDLIIEAPFETTTYYVRFESECDTTSAASVTVSMRTITPPKFMELTEVACTNGPLYLYVVAGQPGSLFTWSITNGTIVNNLNDTVIIDWGSELGSGILEVTETSQEGCISIPVMVTVNITGPVLDLGDDIIICSGESVIITPEEEFDSYLWQDGSTGRDCTTDQEGWIILSVTDSLGCSTMDSMYISVAPLPVVDLGPDTTVCTDEGIILDAGTDGEQYLWSTGALSQQITVYNDGNQEIWAEVQNTFGCTGSDTILIRACDLSHLIDLPTGITPNDDGVNDVWNIKALEQFPDAVVEVYDQWGTLVWRSEPGYPTPWDGRNMRGNQVPFDSYYFVIHFNDGSDERYVGYITVMH